MKDFQDAFISYGRADSTLFATKLHDQLVECGLEVWLDKHDIPLSVDFQNQINDGIEKAHNFIFIIAPHSVQSPYCLREIQHAVQYRKRIIPLLHVKADDFLHLTHPIIRKLNWIWFQEGIDNFETSFAGLLNVLQSHADYVKQHTWILSQALEWEKHQKQTRCLLIGQERIQAENWLREQFQGQQAPCEPSDLHCEFICESTKNADNLMTQVFISYAAADQDAMTQISKTLMRQGITIRTHSVEGEVSAAVEANIQQGVEQANNLIYLVSPSSLMSKACQQAVKQAFADQKRIIALLVQPPTQPKALAALQRFTCIDFRAYQDAALYETAIAKLLNILHQDAHYYEQHKILLVKALKWQRQNRNSSILLRGYNLQHYETWLKLAKQRSHHTPIPLQAEFIAESLNQPPEAALEVFVSYSRADSDLARKLNDALQVQGKTTWFDQESIASGTEFQQEIYRGIESSDNFLFIISPSSIYSPYCKDEVEYAQKLNKRIVTVLHRPVTVQDLHPALASIQWIDFNRYVGDFYANFSELVRVLDTDRIYVQSHTKWSLQALEWQHDHKNPDLLLRGSELMLAKGWLQQAQHQQKQPAPTALQEEFIIASAESSDRLIQQEQERQKRELEQERALRKTAQRTTVGALIGGVALLGVSIAAVLNQIEAWNAENAAQVAQIHTLSASSQLLFSSNQSLEALIASLQAARKLQQLDSPDAQLHDQVRGSLQRIVSGIREHNRLVGRVSRVYSISFSPNGQQLLTSGSGIANLWRATGEPLVQLGGHEGLIRSLSFSPNGWRIATGDQSSTLRLWDLKGNQVAKVPTNQTKIWSLSFNPNGDQLATGGEDGTVKLWRLEGDRITFITQFKAIDGSWIEDISFSPDGQLLAVSGLGGTAFLWDLSGTSPSRRVRLTGHEDLVYSISFSPDGEQIATSAQDGTARLWNLDGNLLGELRGHNGWVYSTDFSPDGRQLVTSGQDSTIRLWSLGDRRQLAELSGHQGRVYDVRFSLDGNRLISSGEDGIVRLWELGNQPLALSRHVKRATSVRFSPDGQIGTTGDDGMVRLWNAAGESIRQFPTSQNRSLSLAFSPTEPILATSGIDFTTRLWDFQGNQLAILEKSQDWIRAVSFSPDGQQIVAAGADGKVYQWNRAGELLHEFQADASEIHSISISPDGQTLATGGDELAALWDFQGNSLAKLDHQSRVLSVSFSPDGKTVASAGADYRVRLWDLEGNQIAQFSGHRGQINSVSFSPDGKLLATGAEDGTARIWDLTGNQMGEFKGNQGAIWSVSFSPDGKTLAASGENGITKLWRVEPIETLDQLLTRGCDWLRDYLQYNPDVEESDRQTCS
ncbi:TIR domain-containing protein [Leptolyngbya sp. FACHB-541]|uniref:TIR domain-containing protein n=1 Tax=Leptolyngbya sp. FACHB-541 TaxID=2692810 RepID=UPI0016860B01|nr:TIR domain-containing protein [Leptolyngbya sp. FACHB-541]MBD2000941.1 TIR domain-containing protein [Leptolyngbya sp. FACHB-541]